MAELAHRPSPAAALEPGQWVVHPGRPDWGLGQIQSVIDMRVTVNFENAGKVLVNAAAVALRPVDEPSADDLPSP